MSTQTDAPEGEGSKTSLIIFSIIAIIVAGLAFNSWRVRTGWLRDLQSDNAEARKAAAAAMMGRGQVAEQLQGNPASIRLAAVRALAAVRTPLAATEIIQFRKDPDDPIKDAATKMLVAMGPDIVMKPAIEGLENSDDAIGGGVQDVLKDGQFTKTDLPVVAHHLLHPDARNNAAGILTDLKLPAIPYVLPYLHPKPGELIGTSTMEDVQLAAIGILDHMDTVDKAPLIIPSLIEMLNYQHTQRAAVGALGRLKPEFSKASVLPLLKVLKENELIRLETVVALGNLKDPRAVQALVPYLGSYSEDLRSQTAEALRAIGAPAVPALLVAAKSPDATVRAAAVRAMGNLPHPDARAAVLTALKDKDADVRVQAATGLRERKDPTTVPALLAAFSDADGRVGTEAAHALAVIGKPAVPSLVGALKAPRGSPQAYYAQQALRDIHSDAVPALTAAARTGDPATARFAALLLGDIGGAEGIAALKDAAQRPMPDVQWAARRSLNTLLGPGAS